DPHVVRRLQFVHAKHVSERDDCPCFNVTQRSHDTAISIELVLESGAECDEDEGLITAVVVKVHVCSPRWVIQYRAGKKSACGKGIRILEVPACEEKYPSSPIVLIPWMTCSRDSEFVTRLV